MKIALFALFALLLGGCTFIYVEGNNNDFKDTGDHGRGLEIERTVPPKQQTLLPGVNGQ